MRYFVAFDNSSLKEESFFCKIVSLLSINLCASINLSMFFFDLKFLCLSLGVTNRLCLNSQRMLLIKSQGVVVNSCAMGVF